MVIDVGSASALIGSLKTAAEMTKAMMDIRDAAILNSKIIELQGVIMSAQQSALSAQADQFAMVERVRHLEKEMAAFEEWDRERQRYELKQFKRGGVAYVLKNDANPPEPMHGICASCYEKGKKSILQTNGKVTWTQHFFVCPSCGVNVAAHQNDLSPKPAE